MIKPRFLIIQLRQIGDVLISTTLCETLKQNYPDAQVDYAVYDYTAPIAENNPFIDNLIVVPSGFAIYKMLKTISFMRRQHYDYAIDILNTPKSVYLATLSGAKKMIGPQNDKNRSRKYDAQIAYNDNFLADDPACISVKNRLCLLTAVNDNLTFSTQYKLHLSEEEIAQAQKLLQQHGVNFDKPLFFFSPGSRSPEQKQWATDNFINVINDCIERYDAQIILYPGPTQTKQSSIIQNKAIKPENIFIFTHYNLREMATIVKLSDLFVGNDSGVAHIAIALGTPSITIFSPAIWHQDWALKNSEKHIAITAQTILKINDDEYETLLIKQTADTTKELYKLIEPNLVKQAIAKLIAYA